MQWLHNCLSQLYLEEVHADQEKELLEGAVLRRVTFLGFLPQLRHRL